MVIFDYSIIFKYFYDTIGFNHQCSPPEIKRNDFYSENDRYFGQFLDSCFDLHHLCPKYLVFHIIKYSKSCNKPIYQHEIQLVHNNKTLRITSSIVGTTKNQSDVIRTWRYWI